MEPITLQEARSLAKRAGKAVTVWVLRHNDKIELLTVGPRGGYRMARVRVKA